MILEQAAELNRKSPKVLEKRPSVRESCSVSEATVDTDCLVHNTMKRKNERDARLLRASGLVT